MKNDLDIINKIYKPYKYTIKGKVKILNCLDRDIVLKPKNEKVIETFKYLRSRGFDNFLDIIDADRYNYNVFPFIYENKVPYEQKCYDLARVAAILHAKTSYNKDVNPAKYDEIYNDILDNCNYLEDYYSKLYDEIFPYEYHKPHEILFLDYYSKLANTIGFCKKELDDWYLLVSGKKTQRVALLHNNLQVDHFIKGEDDYLISFDNARTDTPVFDLVNLFKREYDKTNFSDVFSNYLYHFDYNDDELKLFYILIAIPSKITFDTDNFHNVSMISELINYTNKCEELIMSHYKTSLDNLG